MGVRLVPPPTHEDRHYSSKGDESWLDVPYWICAYANNQHDLGADVTADPSQSSFRKAMALAAEAGGGTVTIVDLEAVTWTRIWCAAPIWALCAES